VAYDIEQRLAATGNAPVDTAIQAAIQSGAPGWGICTNTNPARAMDVAIGAMACGDPPQPPCEYTRIGNGPRPEGGASGRVERAARGSPPTGYQIAARCHVRQAAD